MFCAISDVVINDYGNPNGGVINYNVVATDKVNTGPCGTSNISNTANVPPVFSVSPNPFAQSFKLNIDVAQNTNLQLDLLNTLGQVVYTQPLGTFEPGIYNRQINVPTSVAKGFYYARVTGDNVVSTLKVIKQ